MLENVVQLRIEDNIFSEYNNEIEDFILLLHGSIKNDVYFNLMQLKDKKVVTNEFFNNTGKCIKILEYKSTDTTDTYISINEFNTKRRSNNNTFAFTGLFYDIDCHGVDNVDVVLNYVIGALKNAIDEGVLLLPSCIICSGRGIHIYYVFDKTLPRKKLDWLYVNVAEHFAKIISNIISNIEGATLDTCYNDISHVMRLPYTYNTSAKLFSDIIYINTNNKHEFQRLREIAEIPLPVIHEDKKTKIKNKSKILYFKSGLKLHHDRLNDLIKLIEIRNYDLKGYREFILFLIRYYNNFCDMDNSVKLIQETNNSFKEPLTDREVINSTKSADSAFRRWIMDNKKGYNYKNTTLIKKLEITEQEQGQLTTIISSTERLKRRKAKNWYNGNRDSERRSKRAEKEQVVIDMLNKGHTYSDIIKVTKVGRTKISELKKLLND